MRICLMVAAVILAAGCASGPQAPQAPATVLAAAPSGTVEPGTLQEARKAGYRIVTRDGRTVYCREQLKTGSHLRKEMICLTAEELEVAREASRRNLDQLQRASPPPQGK